MISFHDSQTHIKGTCHAHDAYYARYLSCLFTQRSAPGTAEHYLLALMSANIDIHPHQIDAAVFACRSQYKNGELLADEEGLGKTVEAGAKR